jgi:parallel beta-helix repeat protein
MAWASGDKVTSTNLNTKANALEISVLDPAYSVDTFGANDSSASIQAALDAAGDIGGALVRLPSPATLLCQSGLTIPSYTCLAGQGWQSVLSFDYSGSGTTIHIQNEDTSNGNTDIQLRDFKLMAKGTGVRTGNGPSSIVLTRVDGFDIENVFVERSAGISIAYQSCTNGRIVNNRIKDSEADGITGYWDSTDVVVAGNTINGSGDDGIALDAHTSGNTSSTTGPTRITIHGNTVTGYSTYTSGNVGRGISVRGCREVAVVGNVVSDTYAAGIDVQDDSQTGTVDCFNIDIGNNVVRRAGESGDGAQPGVGIRCTDAEGLTISGNVVSECSHHGIQIGSTVTSFAVAGNSVLSNGKAISHFGIIPGGSFGNVSSNVIEGNAGGGIQMNNASDIVVTGNTIVDNGQAGGGTSDSGSGILVQNATTAVVSGNYTSDTRAAANKTQTYGLRKVNSTATLLVVGNHFSTNSQALKLSDSSLSLVVVSNMSA